MFDESSKCDKMGRVLRAAMPVTPPDRGRYFRAMLMILISVDDSDLDFQT